MFEPLQAANMKCFACQRHFKFPYSASLELNPLVDCKALRCAVLSAVKDWCNACWSLDHTASGQGTRAAYRVVSPMLHTYDQTVNSQQHMVEPMLKRCFPTAIEPMLAALSASGTSSLPGSISAAELLQHACCAPTLRQVTRQPGNSRLRPFLQPTSLLRLAKDVGQLLPLALTAQVCAQLHVGGAARLQRRLSSYIEHAGRSRILLR